MMNKSSSGCLKEYKNEKKKTTKKLDFLPVTIQHGVLSFPLKVFKPCLEETLLFQQDFWLMEHHLGQNRQPSRLPRFGKKWLMEITQWSKWCPHAI